MRLDLFDYHLPAELIADHPAEPRDSSKMMVVDRSDGELVEKEVSQIVDYLSEGDVLVLNETKVIPARLYGVKETGGKIEILIHKQVGLRTYEVLSKPGVKVGTKLRFDDLYGVVVGHREQLALVEFDVAGEAMVATLLRLGKTPLPPYIHAKMSEDEARSKYQTVYARETGSVAAPTAGLHFTPELLAKITGKGVEIVKVWLHVGLGTFASVKMEEITNHVMHEEEFELTEEVARKINNARDHGKIITVVGTTCVRVLESCVDKNGKLGAKKGSTKIFIYPPYKFRVVDQMLTNFHLPKSTLLMLISALVSKPNTDHQFESFEKSLVGRAYQKAITEEWRFFSFGDAMLIK